MENEQIQSECEQAYKNIKESEDKLEELRELCKHEETYEGLYSYRIGCVNTAIMCKFCNKVIEIPAFNQGVMSEAYDEAYVKMINKETI